MAKVMIAREVSRHRLLSRLAKRFVEATPSAAPFSDIHDVTQRGSPAFANISGDLFEASIAFGQVTLTYRENATSAQNERRRDSWGETVARGDKLTIRSIVTGETSIITLRKDRTRQ